MLLWVPVLIGSACRLAVEVSEWVDWGDCSATCGGGHQSRFREVVSTREPGGMGCDSAGPHWGWSEEACNLRGFWWEVGGLKIYIFVTFFWVVFVGFSWMVGLVDTDS